MGLMFNGSESNNVGASPDMSSINSNQNVPLDELIKSGVPIIKSIQRGTKTGTGTVTISTVNPEKCIVLINGSQFGATTNMYSYKASENDAGNSHYLSAMTSNSITIAGGTGIGYYGSAGGAGSKTTNGTCSWQVIEFY